LIQGYWVAMVQTKTKLRATPTPFPVPGQPRRSERRERRSPIPIVVKVCGFSASGRIFSEVATTKNVSRSGCCIRLRAEPQSDGVLALQVVPREEPVPQGPQMLYQVAWIIRRQQGCDVGLSVLGDADLLQVAFASPSA
jgi:hypothetical protein